MIYSAFNLNIIKLLYFYIQVFILILLLFNKDQKVTVSQLSRL